jgi:hypothetical protein
MWSYATRSPCFKQWLSAPPGGGGGLEICLMYVMQE